jgi:biopolymer transport protein ExbD
VTHALAIALLLWGVPPRAPSATVAPERLAAVERCRRGYANLDPTSPSVAADLARACADIYREPACAEAMRNPPKDPARFAATIAAACRDAYCPRLPAPRPKLCASPDLPPPTQLLAEWGVLQQHMLALELGADPKTLAPLFQPVTVAMPRDLSAAPAAPRPTVRVYAKPERAGQARVWIDGGKSIVVLEDDPAGPLSALARETRASAPEGAQIVFSIDKNARYSLVTALIDAFKKEGFHKFAFSVQPSAAPERRPSP